MRCAAAQLPGCGGDSERDIAAAEAAVVSAAAAGAQLVVLPELATLPYFGAAPAGIYQDCAEPVPGPLTRRFGELAASQHIAIVLPLFERDDSAGTWHNSAVVLDTSGQIVSAVDGHGVARDTARKLHLPVGDTPPPGFDEPAHFTAGAALGVHCLRTGAGELRVGVLVCYDRRFPECWRELRALSADVAAVPIAGSGGDDAAFVLGELRTHARENGVAAVAASKVGAEHVCGEVVDNIGESVIVAADGEVLAHRSEADGPGLVVADLDREHIRATRKRLRYYEHRRTDLFGDQRPTLESA